MSLKVLFAAAAGFESARQVMILPEAHRSRRIHGHSFVARVRAALPPEWCAFPGAEVDALRDALADAVAPLDYQSLNLQLEVPTDENISRWIRARLDVPGVETVGVQSTADQGADLNVSGHAHLWRRHRFESAHRLPNVAAGHKCGRMHGHGFEVILHANQDLGRRAIGIDYDRIDELWTPLHAQLDHACLNDIAGLANPTSELISRWIWQQLKPRLPELSWVTVYETASCGAHFDGARFRIWKDMTLDSALQLKRAPEGDPRRRLHGHTYTLRLHLDAPLDEVLGWTMDFGDVKTLFDPIFLELDHQPLNALAGLEDAGTATLAHWIRGRAAPLLPQLDRLDLYQTRGCGTILSWGEGGPALPV